MTFVGFVENEPHNYVYYNYDGIEWSYVCMFMAYWYLGPTSMWLKRLWTFCSKPLTWKIEIAWCDSKNVRLLRQRKWWGYTRVVELCGEGLVSLWLQWLHAFYHSLWSKYDPDENPNDNEGWNKILLNHWLIYIFR